MAERLRGATLTHLAGGAWVIIAADDHQETIYLAGGATIDGAD